MNYVSQEDGIWWYSFQHGWGSSTTSWQPLINFHQRLVWSIKVVRALDEMSWIEYHQTVAGWHWMSMLHERILLWMTMVCCVESCWIMVNHVMLAPLTLWKYLKITFSRILVIHGQAFRARTSRRHGRLGFPSPYLYPSAALGKPNCKVDLKQDCDSKVARGMRICHRIRVGKCILCIPHLCYDHNGDSITQGLWAVRVALGRPWWKVPQWHGVPSPQPFSSGEAWWTGSIWIHQSQPGPSHAQSDQVPVGDAGPSLW